MKIRFHMCESEDVLDRIASSVRSAPYGVRGSTCIVRGSQTTQRMARLSYFYTCSARLLKPSRLLGPAGAGAVPGPPHVEPGRLEPPATPAPSAPAAEAMLGAGRGP